jgi:hypothetical protein
MFTAIDDSWRWRFYTGESVFDTYWVQQLRHLARSKKLGQRRLTFEPIARSTSWATRPPPAPRARPRFAPATSRPRSASN